MRRVGELIPSYGKRSTEARKRWTGNQRECQEKQDSKQTTAPCRREAAQRGPQMPMNGTHRPVGTDGGQIRTAACDSAVIWAAADDRQESRKGGKENRSPVEQRGQQETVALAKLATTDEEEEREKQLGGYWVRCSRGRRAAGCGQSRIAVCCCAVGFGRQKAKGKKMQVDRTSAAHARRDASAGLFGPPY